MEPITRFAVNCRPTNAPTEHMKAYLHLFLYAQYKTPTHRKYLPSINYTITLFYEVQQSHILTFLFVAIVRKGETCL